MAGKKISQFTDGGGLQNTDKLVVARSGANYSILGSEIFTVDTISGLTDGGSLQNTDKLVVARSGANYSILASELCNLCPPGDTSPIVNVKNTEVDVVSTTTETDLYSYTIPANSLGTNGAYMMEILGSYLNNTGVNRTLELNVYYGATSENIHSLSIASSASRYIYIVRVLLRASGATNVQHVSAEVTKHATIMNPREYPSTFAVDSTANNDMKITVKHSGTHASLSFILRHGRTTYLPEA